MNVIGIVAEYNPFHTGHAYQIAQSRAQLGENAPVVAVMSGNWVQQAHCAIADKWTRARLALMGGADLVLELPTVFACSSVMTRMVLIYWFASGLSLPSVATDAILSTVSMPSMTRPNAA